jgi:hypothetical protein
MIALKIRAGTDIVDTQSFSNDRCAALAIISKKCTFLGMVFKYLRTIFCFFLVDLRSTCPVYEFAKKVENIFFRGENLPRKTDKLLLRCELYCIHKLGIPEYFLGPFRLII